MPNAHIVLHLMATYGYPGLLLAMFLAALGIGAPIPVTALLLTLGALSGSRGGPSFVLLAAAGLVGAVGGHLGDYWAGRAGTNLILRRLQPTRPGAVVHRLFQRATRLRGGRWLLVFVSRFLLTPIASPVSLLAGLTRMPFGRYLALETLGEAIYVLGNLTLGRIFGPRLLAHSNMLFVAWGLVALATLVPVGLVWLASRALNRASADASTSYST
jgi:membrane-associated protein